jgi:GAF domain-containing protein
MPEQHEADLRILVEEQAALNRVAVAVATETSAERVFDVVTEEVARLLGADAANLVRFGPTPDEGVIVGKWSEPGVPIPGAGTVVEIRGGALAAVARTRAPARMALEDPDVLPELHARLVELGVTSVVAAPIVVSGELWGAVVASVTRDLQFAANAEERLGKFAGLVAVALANTQAREELGALADEQAALSRVAVAVATEEDPERLFNAVSEELGRLFGARAAAVVRYVGAAGGAEIVGGWERDGRLDAAPLGPIVPVEGGAIAQVAQTGRTARIDLENEPPELQEQMVEAEVSSGVAAPIVVSGRLWGSTSITVDGSDRFPRDAEARLEKFTSLERRGATGEVRRPRRGRARERRGPRAAESVARAHRPGG